MEVISSSWWNLQRLGGMDWWHNHSSFGKFPLCHTSGRKSGPQSIGSHPANGACNSLSCTIRSCVIRSESSSMFALHVRYVASNFATVRSQVTTWLHANPHHILGKQVRLVRSFNTVRSKYLEIAEYRGRWMSCLWQQYATCGTLFSFASKLTIAPSG